MIYSWANVAGFRLPRLARKGYLKIFSSILRQLYGFECRLRPVWDIANLRKFRHAND